MFIHNFGNYEIHKINDKFQVVDAKTAKVIKTFDRDGDAWFYAQRLYVKEKSRYHD